MYIYVCVCIWLGHFMSVVEKNESSNRHNVHNADQQHFYSNCIEK